MKAVHNSFKVDAEVALRKIALKYNIGLESLGVAAKDDAVIVVAKFSGEPQKPKPKGVMAYFQESN